MLRWPMAWKRIDFLVYEITRLQLAHIIKPTTCQHFVSISVQFLCDGKPLSKSKAHHNLVVIILCNFQS